MRRDNFFSRLCEEHSGSLIFFFGSLLLIYSSSEIPSFIFNGCIANSSGTLPPGHYCATDVCQISLDLGLLSKWLTLFAADSFSVCLVLRTSLFSTPFFLLFFSFISDTIPPLHIPADVTRSVKLLFLKFHIGAFSVKTGRGEDLAAKLWPITYCLWSRPKTTDHGFIVCIDCVSFWDTLQVALKMNGNK